MLGAASLADVFDLKDEMAEVARRKSLDRMGTASCKLFAEDICAVAGLRRK